GFVWHDDRFWLETENVVAELARTLHDERPLFRQLGAREKVSTVRRFRETVQELELERDDGVRKTLEARGLDDVVACFNEELRARRQERRIVPLEPWGRWRLSVPAELRLLRKLAAEGALPVVSLAALSD